MNKQKKHTEYKSRKPNTKQVDNHHLLWPKNGWTNKYAQALRCHPYCQKNVKRHSLHVHIHCAIMRIPTPSEKDCKRALERINWRLACKVISLDDIAQKRLDVLIDLFGKNPNNYATIRALEAQRDMIASFYAHYKKGGY